MSFPLRCRLPVISLSLDNDIWLLVRGSPFTVSVLLAFSELKEYDPSANKWMAHSDPPWGTWGRTSFGMTRYHMLEIFRLRCAKSGTQVAYGASSVGEDLWVYGGQDQTEETHEDMYKYSRSGWEQITPSSSLNPSGG